MSEDAKQEFIKEHTMEEFREGLKLKEGLKPIRMPGGVLLVKKGYDMRPKAHKKIKED